MLGGGENDSILIAVVVIVVIISLFFMIKPKRNAKERYNGGNNIDFRKQDTDRNLPDDVMPHTDVPNVGSPFVIIDNS